MAHSASAFVPLDVFVRGVSEPIPARSDAAAPMPRELDAALHDVRRFRAALGDALEAAREDLLRDVASAVLARELAIAPAEIARIVQSALGDLWNEQPLMLLAHPEELSELGGFSLPVRGDASLRRGDVTIALRYGSIDLTLGARLADVLERLR